MVGGGPDLQVLQGFGADTSSRHIDDAVEADGIGRVMNQSQIGDHVFDFAPFVELGGTDETVGHVGAHEGFFEDAGLGVGAVHDGDVAGGVAIEQEALQGGDDDVAFFLIVVGFADDDEFAALRVR